LSIHSFRAVGIRIQVRDSRDACIAKFTILPSRVPQGVFWPQFSEIAMTNGQISYSWAYQQAEHAQTGNCSLFYVQTEFSLVPFASIPSICESLLEDFDFNIGKFKIHMQ
jgi:hypothetical protein